MFLNTRASLGADVAVHVGLAAHLAKAKVGVWVATNTYEQYDTSARAAFEAIPDITLLPMTLGRPLVTTRGLELLKALAFNIFTLFNLIRLAAICRKQGIDIIHVTERPRDMLFGLVLSRLAGKALLIHAHTAYYKHDATKRDNWILRKAAAIVGVSKFTALTYQSAGELPASKVFFLHNAVSSAFIKPALPEAAGLNLRASFAIPADAPLIGCVARLSRWKDQETLLEALVEVRKVLPKTQLLLAGGNSDNAPDGHGSYKDYLKRRIAALGLEQAVKFTGFLPPSKMPYFYAAIDLLAHPAVEEPFGLALVEAMAMQVPVIAVNAGGVPEIIRNGIDGLLIPSKQPLVLANAIQSLLLDPVLAKKLVISAQERVFTTFNPTEQATNLLQIYQQVIKGRANSKNGWLVKKQQSEA